MGGFMDGLSEGFDRAFGQAFHQQSVKLRDERLSEQRQEEELIRYKLRGALDGRKAYKEAEAKDRADIKTAKNIASEFGHLGPDVWKVAYSKLRDGQFTPQQVRKQLQETATINWAPNPGDVAGQMAELEGAAPGELVEKPPEEKSPEDMKARELYRALTGSTDDTDFDQAIGGYKSDVDVPEYELDSKSLSKKYYSGATIDNIDGRIMQAEEEGNHNVAANLARLKDSLIEGKRELGKDANEIKILGQTQQLRRGVLDKISAFKAMSREVAVFVKKLEDNPEALTRIAATAANLESLGREGAALVSAVSDAFGDDKDRDIDRDMVLRNLSGMLSAGKITEDVKALAARKVALVFAYGKAHGTQGNGMSNKDYDNFMRSLFPSNDASTVIDHLKATIRDNYEAQKARVIDLGRDAQLSRLEVGERPFFFQQDFDDYLRETTSAPVYDFISSTAAHDVLAPSGPTTEAPPAEGADPEVNESTRTVTVSPEQAKAMGREDLAGKTIEVASDNTIKVIN